jgi:hypothetical protein
MGDKNQGIYLKRNIPKITGPVLEIGSKDHGNTSSFRDTFSGEYVGVDIAPGRGVDVVWDLSNGTGDLPLEHFELATCCSILEHVPKPWLLAENLSKLVKKGGYIFVSGPWCWRYHPYPDDYYRLSFSGIKVIFPEFTWGKFEYSTNVEGEFLKATKDRQNIYELDSTLRRMEDDRIYMPYLNINMIGVKN